MKAARHPVGGFSVATPQIPCSMIMDLLIQETLM